MIVGALVGWGARVGGVVVAGSLLSFFENRKKKFVFERKCLEIVSKVSPRKNSRFDPCGAFFLVVFTKYLSKGPNSIRPPCPERFLVACQLLCLTKSNRPLHFYFNSFFIFKEYLQNVPIFGHSNS